jgi:hypothetical protein
VLCCFCCRALFAVDAVFGAFFFANLLLQLHIPVRVSASFYQLLLHNGWGVFKVYRRQVRAEPLLLLQRRHGCSAFHDRWPAIL